MKLKRTLRALSYRKLPCIYLKEPLHSWPRTQSATAQEGHMRNRAKKGYRSSGRFCAKSGNSIIITVNTLFLLFSIQTQKRNTIFRQQVFSKFRYTFLNTILYNPASEKTITANERSHTLPARRTLYYQYISVI